MKSLKFFFLFLMIVSLVYAYDFDPKGNINLKNRYSIINATNISSTQYCDLYNCYQLADLNASANASGTVTSVGTDDVYLTGGPITGAGTITFNESVLNTTIDARQTGGGDRWTLNLPWLYNNTGNLDWNESLGNLTWSPISLVTTQSNDNTTQANQIANLNASIGTGGGNINGTDINVTSIRYGKEYISDAVTFRHEIIDQEVYAIWQ